MSVTRYPIHAHRLELRITVPPPISERFMLAVASLFPDLVEANQVTSGVAHEGGSSALRWVVLRARARGKV